MVPTAWIYSIQFKFWLPQLYQHLNPHIFHIIRHTWITNKQTSNLCLLHHWQNAMIEQWQSNWQLVITETFLTCQAACGWMSDELPVQWWHVILNCIFLTSLHRACSQKHANNWSRWQMPVLVTHSTKSTTASKHSTLQTKHTGCSAESCAAPWWLNILPVQFHSKLVLAESWKLVQHQTLTISSTILVFSSVHSDTVIYVIVNLMINLNYTVVYNIFSDSDVWSMQQNWSAY